MDKNKLNVLVMLFALVVSAVGCMKSERESDLQLSDEQISANLLLSGDANLFIDGKFDPKLLDGEWEPVKFAYTPDGNKISNEDFIPFDHTVRIRYADTPMHLHDQLGTHSISVVFANRGFVYSTSSCFFNLKSKIYIYRGISMQYYNKIDEVPETVIKIQEEVNKIDSSLDIPEFTDEFFTDFFADFFADELTGEELKLYNAFSNAYSFVIKNDELIIYFTGNKNKNLNLLILKKN